MEKYRKVKKSAGFVEHTLAAAKMLLTDLEISGPIPSPSMKVTV